MQDFEKLGVFYLGRQYDLAARQDMAQLVLYDAKDLTTHAVCVGMTGSGKTGLCLALLEEAAIDGVPAIAIDPKGDLGNLLLTFPELRPEDFRPWVDESDAARKNLSVDQLAAETARQWREGLSAWGQDSARIARLRAAAEVAIYTPGSSAGLPLTVLRSFSAPPATIIADAEALRERIGGAAAGLLALVGVEADPIQSREHILISQLLDQSWRAGRDLDISTLVRDIQSPPFERVGVVDLETFFPAKDRMALAMRLNNLLASPSFAGWLEGEPLDINSLLYTAEGKPRLSILSIAHLSDAERMFFVTILLNEILTWVRTQPGTSSLRAILYMDEVAGYFPPSAIPPTKPPMLTLLKQARAYGLGIVLATQNPVDLDYKALSNTGTWLLGRLQTERDKARVLEGLEGASAAAGSTFNRAQTEATLAALGNRVFLMNNVHEDHPLVFQSRWCLSYLRGPLTRTQIQTLMAGHKQSRAEGASRQGAGETIVTQAAGPAAASAVSSTRPLVPQESGECYMALGEQPSTDGALYRPALLGMAKLHFVDSKAGVDVWREIATLTPPGSDPAHDAWAESREVPQGQLHFEQPVANAQFAHLSAEFARAKSYAAWQKSLVGQLYRTAVLPLWTVVELKAYSQPGESQGQFRVRMQQSVREARDAKVEALRQRYAPKLAALKNQLKRAEERAAREQSQFRGQVLQTAVSIGSSIVGALLGRKLTSRTNVSSAASAARTANRAARERQDAGRAAEATVELQAKLAELEQQVQAAIAKIEVEYAEPQLTPYAVKPRKSDIAVTKVALAWVR